MMTIRQQYAAAAMQAIISSLGHPHVAAAFEEDAAKCGVSVKRHIADIAFDQADAMLEAENGAPRATEKQA